MKKLSSKKLSSLVPALFLGSCVSLNSPPIQPLDVPVSISESDIMGNWIVATVNRKRTDGRPFIDFHPSYYGGYNGCNSFGATGLLDNGRYYSATQFTTLMGCRSNRPEGRRQLAMGLTAAQIIMGNPAIKVNDRGNLIVRTKNGSIMGLRKTKKPNIRQSDQPEIPSLRDTRWEIDSINRSFFPGYAAKGERMLQFGTTEWHLKLSCATLRGQWVQSGYNISLSNVT